MLMKRLIVLILSLFITSCFLFDYSFSVITRKKLYGTDGKTQVVSKKAKTQEIELDAEDAEEDEVNLVEAFDLQSYIKSLKPIKLRKMIQDAEFKFETGEFDLATKIYEVIAAEYKDPLAYYRLGEIYEKQGENSLHFLSKSYMYFERALKNGFVQAIEKLLIIGKTCVKAIKNSAEKPMSEEARRMYL